MLPKMAPFQTMNIISGILRTKFHSGRNCLQVDGTAAVHSKV